MAVVFKVLNDAAVNLNGLVEAVDVQAPEYVVSYSLVGDKVLIHGDVSGKTKVNVERSTKYLGTRSLDRIDSNALRFVNRPLSISLIQVFGQAEADSFSLNGEYITLGGLPYKFVLRAYGPRIPAKMNYFDKELVANSKSVWDFRLEDSRIPHEPTIYFVTDTVAPTSTSTLPLTSTSSAASATSSAASAASSAASATSSAASAPIVSSPSGPGGRVLLNSSGGVETVSIPSFTPGGDLPSVPVFLALNAAPNGFTPVVSYASYGRSDRGEDSIECSEVGQNGEGESQTPYSCSDGQSHTIENLTLQATGKNQHSIHARNNNTVLKLEKVVISSSRFSDEDDVDLAQTPPVSAVLAEEGAEVVLAKSTVTSSLIGLEAQRGGKVKMDGGTVSADYVGVLAGDESSVNLSGTEINVGDGSAAGLVSTGGEITMSSGTITLMGEVAVRSEAGGRVKLEKVNITAKNGERESNSAGGSGRSAFLLSSKGSVELKDGNVRIDGNGFWIRDTGGGGVKPNSSRRRRSAEIRPSVNWANVESSTVVIEGEGRYGIYFDGSGRVRVPSNDSEPLDKLDLFSLKKTVLQVPKSVAIYSNNSDGRISLEKETEITGDLLLRSENKSRVLVSTSGSKITGGVRVDNSSYGKIELSGNSEWILTTSSYKPQNMSSSDSYISSVSLVNSAIRFAVPASEEHQYQTLRIGKGSGTVYEAQGEAHVYLNTYLNKGGKLQEQKTDRLLIHGDVSGKTILHIHSVAGSPGGATGLEGNNKGISVVQVHGSAQEDSFQLAGGYVTLENSPYQYRLHAYGVSSKLGTASPAQKLVESGGEFWDFRLENGSVDFYTPSKPAPGSGVVPGPHLRPDDGSEFVPDPHLRPVEPGVRPIKPGVRAVVPQLPTYLLLSNSVFHAGLVDISNQNKQLEMLRTTSSGMVEVRERPALYLHSYGGHYRYHSDLSALEYGYGGNLNYNAVETGVLLQTIENTTSILSLGVLGSYGKLSLQPLNVEHSQESAFDKWTATVYGSMQHDNGFYVDGLFSYGLLKGDVRTSVRGRTATLKGKPFSVSLTGGQAFAIGYESFVLDPQVQVIYQRLQFSNARDVDNFDIELGGLNQWVARVGGRLIKVPKNYEGVNSIALYGKVYLSHGFGERQAVRFKDSFQLGNFGSTLEAGLGFNARLSGSLVLHADMVYQRKLTKAGFSGASFSGGVHYRF